MLGKEVSNLQFASECLTILHSTLVISLMFLAKEEQNNASKINSTLLCNNDASAMVKIRTRKTGTRKEVGKTKSQSEAEE